MNGKNITITKIRLDSSKRVNDETKTKVLLYNRSEDCYYETTIEAICSSLIRRIDARLGEVEQTVSELKRDCESRMAEMERDQSEFIKDSAEVNKALIEMVKNQK